MLFSVQGMACRFTEDKVRPTGRVGKGIIGIRLGKKEDDAVIAMSVVDKGVDIINVTEKGMGKRSNIGTGFSQQDKETGGGYRLTNRGGKGVTSIKLKPGDKVVGALKVDPGDEIMMTTIQGQMVRISVDEVRSIGRSSQGVKVIDLRGRDKVASVTSIQELKEEESDEDDSSEPQEDTPENIDSPES